MNKLQELWYNVLWTDEAKVGLVGSNAQQHVYQKPNTVFQQKHLKHTVTRGLFGMWMLAAGPGHLAVIESNLNSL